MHGLYPSRAMPVHLALVLRLVRLHKRVDERRAAWLAHTLQDIDDGGAAAAPQINGDRLSVTAEN